MIVNILSEVINTLTTMRDAAREGTIVEITGETCQSMIDRITEHSNLTVARPRYKSNGRVIKIDDRVVDKEGNVGTVQMFELVDDNWRYPIWMVRALFRQKNAHTTTIKCDNTGMCHAIVPIEESMYSRNLIQKDLELSGSTYCAQYNISFQDRNDADAKKNKHLMERIGHLVNDDGCQSNG